MVVAKRQGKEKPVKNRTKEGLRTGVRTSGRTYSTPGQPNLQRAGPGGGGKTYKKRSQNWAEGLSSLHLFWVSMLSCLKDVFSFTF